MKGILPVEATKLVNKVGKYIYNHLDGAFKFKTSSNTFDIYTTVLYQLPWLQRIPGKGKEYNDVHEMTLNISITTYQNKIRVNMIEMTPNQRTFGYDLYKPEELTDLQIAYDEIYDKICRRIKRTYKDYEFLF